jgi:hypothetical protein
VTDIPRDKYIGVVRLQLGNQYQLTVRHRTTQSDMTLPKCQGPDRPLHINIGASFCLYLPTAWSAGGSFTAASAAPDPRGRGAMARSQAQPVSRVRQAAITAGLTTRP